MKRILAIIPARSGSKNISHKNIQLINGKPMLAYSIEHALSSKYVNRVIVSTDSEYYASIAKEHGAEVPFLRPIEISQDDSTDLEVFLHALEWLKKHSNYEPDICIHLRPTYPIRDPNDIDRMVDILLQNPEADSIRSVSLASETPYKMWFQDEAGLLSPIIQLANTLEAYNMPRQKLPAAYFQNACIDVIRTTVITEQKSMTGKKIMGYLMQQNFDIDTQVQLQKAEEYMKKNAICDELISQQKQKIFCFDIDGVIATLVQGNQYNLAKPKSHMIELINLLYKKGHKIILFTARGSATGIDWVETTKKQMNDWGVKYHDLLFGKPAADFYIDDRLLSVEQLEKIIQEIEK